jgi:hypothetical protein
LFKQIFLLDLVSCLPWLWHYKASLPDKTQMRIGGSCPRRILRGSAEAQRCHAIAAGIIGEMSAFNHWRTLRRLQSKKDEISRKYSRERLKEDNVAPEKQQELWREQILITDSVQDDINQELTWYWVNKANSLSVRPGSS